MGLTGPIHNDEWAAVPYVPIPMGANVPVIAVTSPEGATAFLDTRDRREDRVGRWRTQSENDVDELRERTLAREALDAEDDEPEMEEVWEELVYWEEGMPVVDWGQEEMPVVNWGGEEGMSGMELGGEEMPVVHWGGEEEAEVEEEVEEETAIEHWEGVGPSGEPLNGPFASRGVPSRRWSF